MFNKAYTFDDVALVPRYNEIQSRLHTTLDTKLTKKISVNNPLIPANMDTVISFNLAEKVIEDGGIPIFHRFCSIEEQVKFCETFKDNCFVSCGVNDDEFNKLEQLFNAGALGVCIDIAHGHSKVIIDLISKIKKAFPDKEVIAGNICSEEAYIDLVNAGVDAVKVGVGPGAACTTRIVTGFGVPQFTAIYNIAQARNKLLSQLQVPIIADGGIRNSRDVALALAAGANSVMIGNLFSKTLESASNKYYKDKLDKYNPILNLQEIYNKYENNFEIYSHYRGQASKNFQNEYFGKLKKGTVAEGIDFHTKCSGPVENLYNEINGGLRSALTYAGAKNIEEFQKNAEFVEVTENYMGESKPRDKQ
jgi:IMP dehydrogenase